MGTTAPRGLLLDAATGVTGPAGTGTTLGTQGTANQGTDALWNLVGLAWPSRTRRRRGPRSCSATRRTSSSASCATPPGSRCRGSTTRGQILGYPSYLDAFMPAMANTAESIAFGDMSRYLIRIVNGVRFER